MMDVVSFGGAFCTGKSTTFNAVREKFKHDERFIFTEEEARKIIERAGKPISEFSKQEIIDMQMDLIDKNINDEAHAAQEGKIAVLETSVVENIAYIQDHVNKHLYTILNNILSSRASSYRYIYFPPKSRIALMDDGVRHVNKTQESESRQFQHTIAARIKDLLQEHNIQHYTMDRVDQEVRNNIIIAKLEHVAKENGLVKQTQEYHQA